MNRTHCRGAESTCQLVVKYLRSLPERPGHASDALKPSIASALPNPGLLTLIHRSRIHDIDTYVDTSQRRVVPQLDLFVKLLLEATPVGGHLVICCLKNLVSPELSLLGPGIISTYPSVGIN